MKGRMLIIGLGMIGIVSSQTVVTNVKCHKKCFKYYKEDSKGNTIHTKDCMAEVYMDDLDPCLFDKYELAHPLHIELYQLREEVAQLREIIEKQRNYLESIRLAANKD